MRKIRYAFTLIELVFVIVIMGILSKFGIEFLSQAYQSFIFTKVNNTLQANSGVAVQTIAARLQYRIKDSIIAKNSNVFPVVFEGLGGANNPAYNVLEWVGYDIEGYRGDSSPNWSGIIDLDASSSNNLRTPETNTTKINNLIAILADNNGTNDTTINNAAIYFIGSDSNVNNYGWDGGALTDHNTSVMHRINSIPGAGNTDKFSSGIAVDFNGSDVYEYYQLAWTAYAVELSNTGDLRLYWDYQPWEGEVYNNAAASSTLIMQNVDTFKFKSVGSVVKIQVCVHSTVISGSNSDQDGGYSLCKEKTIY